MAARVQNSTRLLMKIGAELGPRMMEGMINVNGVSAYNIYMGDKAQGNNFELVDGLTNIMDGTATIFSKTGLDFIRISTNVIKENKRAIGTKLSHTGKAIDKINQGQAYYGKVHILGNPYLTYYAPLKDASGSKIGIWYVGYFADLASTVHYIPLKAAGY
ncbi:methyl-accepting chemotaxis protein [Paraglaciecola psychrophila 170]|uniref:Methyl-accepting chemotaxis protein n=2 Tax=Paraglaciecola TaxID=1621534 RepID=M4RH32_9ALTE|nr:methyl-accepting chemotaxis protein [Paraglaciecola psychrophila 170]